MLAPDILVDRKGVLDNLKWSTRVEDRELIAIFLKHIVLLVGAEARASGVGNVTLHWSYPSSFANEMRTGLVQAWHAQRGFAAEMGLELAYGRQLTESVADCR